MKRIFCDCCSEEFSYDSAVSKLNDRSVQGYIRTPNRTINFSVRVKFEIEAPNGEHIDLCAPCRWKHLTNLVKPGVL